MIRAYLLLGATALFGNGMTLAPVVARYHHARDEAPAPVPAPASAPASAHAPSPAIAVRARTAIRSADGLFRLTATVDRRPVTFIVDTGATVTVLSGRDAARIGLAPAPADRAGSLVTAGGAAPMAWKRIDGLVVAGTGMGAMEVAVGGDAVAHSLLGQDVLSRLGAITISGDRLEVRPAAS